MVRIGTAATLLTACFGEAPVTAPAEGAPAVAPELAQSSWDKFLKTAIRELGQLLPCEPEPYQKVTKTIGAAGGSIAMGNHRLDIPAGALDRDIAITAEVIPWAVNSVRLSPEGLKFGRVGVLTMSYRNCQSVKASKKVAYTTEDLEIIELLESADKPGSKQVQGAISHFSRYAVAW
jgi:hypothetical protein